MNQALYAHMNNKRKMKKKKRIFLEHTVALCYKQKSLAKTCPMSGYSWDGVLL
jgi:hypothetical protein